MIAAANVVYGTPEWLAEFRAVAVIGWLILAGFWAFDTYEIYRLWKPRRPAKAASETCKLHSRPVGTCPPGSHDDD